MLHNAIRMGDTTSHGGRVVSGNSTYMIFGKPVACVGDMVICPLCKVPTVIVEGDASWRVHGRNVAVAGCKTSCGAVLIASQGSVSGDRETAGSIASIVKNNAEPASIAPITGDATTGLMKRYTNAATLGAAFPEKLTAAEEKGIGAAIRNLYGGNDTIQNQADIATYNDKPSSLGVTHGEIFDTSEAATGVLGIAAGGLGAARATGIGRAAEVVHPGLHNQSGLAVDVPRGSFKTLRQVDMENLSPADEAAIEALSKQNWKPKEMRQILQSGEDFKVTTAGPGDKLYGFGTAGRGKDVKTSAYWLDEVGYKDVENKFLKNGTWDKEGVKGYLALPCYNRATTIDTVEVAKPTTLVQARIGKATELIQYSDGTGYTTGTMGKIMGGGGWQSTANPDALKLTGK